LMLVAFEIKQFYFCDPHGPFPQSIRLKTSSMRG
jgi:hypothetical protein